MDVKTLKYEIIEWITETKDISLLKNLKFIKDSNDTCKNWYEDLGDEELASINRGVSNHENGEVLSSREFWSDHED